MAIEPEYTCPYFKRRNPAYRLTEYKIYSESGDVLIRMRHDPYDDHNEYFIRPSVLLGENRLWYPAEIASSTNESFQDFAPLYNLKFVCKPIPSTLFWYLAESVREAFCAHRIKLYFTGDSVYLDGSRASDEPLRPILFKYTAHYQIERGSIYRGRKPDEFYVTDWENPVNELWVVHSLR